MRVGAWPQLTDLLERHADQADRHAHQFDHGRSPGRLDIQTSGSNHVASPA